MGSLTASSATSFARSPEDVYDFVTDPRNWPKTYPGSGKIEGADAVPLHVGDTWSESGRLGDLDVRYTWRLITAVRPWRWVFQSVGTLAHDPADHSGGFDGITTISYTFERSGAGVTLFQRSMTTEIPRHGSFPQQVVAAHDPAAIDAYHEAVSAALG